MLSCFSRFNVEIIRFSEFKCFFYLRKVHKKPQVSQHVGYLHGDRENELNGGTCAEFFKLNDLSQCCAAKQDECYMIHYDTRCYCDVFCNRPSSDCCSDAISVCDDNFVYFEIENKITATTKNFTTSNPVEPTTLRSRISTKREAVTIKNDIQKSTEVDEYNLVYEEMIPTTTQVFEKEG